MPFLCIYCVTLIFIYVLLHGEYSGGERGKFKPSLYNRLMRISEKINTVFSGV